MAESNPALDSGLIDTISFDGVTAQVVRRAGSETYFALSAPDAAPCLYTSPDIANEDLLNFVREHLGEVRAMRTEIIKRYAKGASQLKYRSGECVEVLGRPFMLRVVSTASGQAMKHSSRGRSQTFTRVNNAVGLLELHVFKANDFTQRKETFFTWARPILLRNGERLCREAAQKAGLEAEVPSSFRVRSMRNSLVRIDRTQDTVWLSDELVHLPIVCTIYAFARQLAKERPELVEQMCPQWEQAKNILDNRLKQQ